MSAENPIEILYIMRFDKFESSIFTYFWILLLIHMYYCMY